MYRVNPSARCRLAFTRYSFTSQLSCTSHSSLYCLAPPCIAHTIAIQLHDFCALYDPPPAFVSDAIHHTILVTAISCKGQDASVQERRLLQISY